MEPSTTKEDGDFAKSLEDELMNCTGDFEDEKAGTYFVQGSEKMDEEVGVMECSGSGGHEHEPVEAEHSDTTECSSSFDGSDCGAEGVDSWGDVQVESTFGNLFTKRRKLSSHWRAFIHPLMWRCKWVELQIKKLDAQARAYAHNNATSEALWRKRRRRTEATNDIAAYMSRHNLFSYYEHRKYIRGIIAHNVLKNSDTREEAKSDGELGNDEARDCDKDLEDILGRLEALHSRVLKLKSLVVKERDDWRSLIWHKATLDLPPNPTTTYQQMPVGTYVTSQLLAEYNLGGSLLPESEAAPLAKERTDHPRSSTHAYQNDDDDVLIDNQRVREELPYFERGNIDLIKKPCVVVNDALATTSRAKPPQSGAQARSTLNLTNATKTNTQCKHKRGK